MKRTTVPLLLVAFLIMLTTPFAVTPDSKPKATAAQINYYWFDAYNNYLYRQNTLEDEMALTGFDESTQNPKTLQEKGWAPGSCTFDSWGNPVPTTSVPDKTLYSHP